MESIEMMLAQIFTEISGTGKWSQYFLLELFSNIFSLQGRVNFANLARFSKMNEVTFRRNFGKFFDWLGFNFAVFRLFGQSPQGVVLGVVDCSLIPKSGKSTYGLDRFWSGVAGKAKRGLEISVLGLIDVASATAWTLDVTQTPPGLSASESASGHSRIDFYTEQLTDCLACLKAVTYFVADGFYAKTKIFDAFSLWNKHLITKLRPDADLRYRFKGERKKGQRGATPKYGGKVDFKKLDLSLWTEVGADEKYPYLHLYSEELYAVKFRRWLRVVLVLNTKTNQYVLLACSDLSLCPRLVLSYNQLRFQVEFLFRDAKQFAGLTHCQARDEDKLDFHFNMSMSAINLAQVNRKLNPSVSSMNCLVRRAYNQKFEAIIILPAVGVQLVKDKEGGCITAGLLQPGQDGRNQHFVARHLCLSVGSRQQTQQQTGTAH